MEKWRWYFIQNPVYMKTRIPIRILCFVGSDIKLLRIFNALTNYFHTKSCFRESLFCFRNAVFLLLKSDSTSKETHSLLIDAPPMTSKILVDFLTEIQDDCLPDVLETLQPSVLFKVRSA